ncbi:MAG TPA: AI-2E family transporter [Tepidisphaeraceae bacterium]|nr:AI-2E family transporter [Tepidisphaeraceae bacterium]
MADDPPRENAPRPIATAPRSNDGATPRSLPVWLAPAGWLILIILVLFFFSPVSTVVLGVLAACIIACTLRPLMDWIPGPRGVDVAVLGVGMVAIVGVVAFLLYWPLQKPIGNAVVNWPETKRDVDQSLARWSGSLGMKDPLTFEVMADNVRGFLTGQGGLVFSRTADIVLGILLSLAFTLVGSIFLLSEPPEGLIKPVLRIFPQRHRPALRAAMEDLEPRYRAWAVGTLTGMAVVFTASMIGYTVIGLKMAIPLALLAGVAEIVPTVGPAIACVIAALFAGATQSGTAAGLVLLVWGCIQALEAYVILPLIMKGAVNVHPAITLFTVVLWGKIFGVAGLMLAIPINLTIWTFLEHIRLKFLDEGGG